MSIPFDGRDLSLRDHIFLHQFLYPRLHLLLLIIPIFITIFIIIINLCNFPMNQDTTHGKIIPMLPPKLHLYKLPIKPPKIEQVYCSNSKFWQVFFGHFLFYACSYPMENCNKMA